MNKTVPIGIIYPSVMGRSPHPKSPLSVYEHVKSELTNRPWETFMIHQPAGWVNSMTGAQWFTMSYNMQDAYTAAILEALAERQDIKGIWIYGGLQWYSMHSNVGDPAPAGERFKGGYWADPSSKTTVRGVLQTIKEWANRGVTGWVFDSGGRYPVLVKSWMSLIQDEIDPLFTIGLEPIPMVSSNVNWEPAATGLHYHSNLRYRSSLPFIEDVPAHADAFAWIRHKPFPTILHCKLLMSRGWRLAPDSAHDQIVLEALDDDVQPAVSIGVVT